LILFDNYSLDDGSVKEDVMNYPILLTPFIFDSFLTLQ